MSSSLTQKEWFIISEKQMLLKAYFYKVLRGNEKALTA
jgi:hypothetical protein